MSNRIQNFIPLILLMFASQAIETHFRAGVDFNLLKIGVDSVSKIYISKPCPLPQVTTEVRKTVNTALDFGISGTYTPIFIGNENHHALKVGMHSYIKYYDNNAVGLGIHIHHVPLNSIDPSLFGYLNNISLGLSIQGIITNNLYTHFEVRQDFTPQSQGTWESHLASQNQIIALAPSLLNFKYFSSSVSIGYILPND